MPRYITVTPAYGRDYRSAAAAKEAWLEGKDFVYHGSPFDPDDGRYCSVRDFKEPGIVVNIRYARREKIVVVKGGK